jgi:type II secretion system protein N
MIKMGLVSIFPLSPAKKIWLKWTGYPTLGVITFIFAFHYTFPYARLKDKIEGALSTKYDVNIKKARAGVIPGHMILEDITLSTRPEREGEKVTTLEIEEVDVSIGIFAALGGDTAIDFDAVIGAGSLSGSFRQSGKAMTVDLHTEGLPLETVPGIGMVAGGAPLKGAMDIDAKINLPKGKWREAQGSLALSCSGCVMGDGVTAMRPTAAKARNAFSDAGFTLPPTRLGKVTGKIQIKKGILCIDQFESNSPDGELFIEGGIKLDDPFARSNAQLYARFKVSDEYKRKNEKMGAAMAGIPQTARRPDGYVGYFSREPVGGLWWKPAANNPAPMRECGASGGDTRADKGRKTKDNKDRNRPGVAASPTGGGAAPGGPGVTSDGERPFRPGGPPNLNPDAVRTAAENRITLPDAAPPPVEEPHQPQQDEPPQRPPPGQGDEIGDDVKIGGGEVEHDTDPDQPQQQPVIEDQGGEQ